MKIIRNYWPFFLFLLIILFSARKFLFKDGYILYGEYFSTTDYFFYLKDFLKTWSDNTSLGHSNIGFPTTYGLNPVFFINSPGFVMSWLTLMSILQLVFGQLTSKIYLLIAFFVPFWGMYFFSKYWFKYPKAISFLSGLIYLTSAQVIDRIYAGHIHYVFGYGILPFLLLFIVKSSEEKKPKLQRLYLLASGLTASYLLWYMPHLFTFLAFMLFFYFILFITTASIHTKKSFFMTIIVCFFLAILLNVHAWLPAIFYPENYPFLKNLTYSFQSVYYSSSRANLKDILNLGSGFQERLHLLDNFKKLKTLRSIFPILSLLGLILYKERRKSLFAFFLIISGLILSLGTNSPFGRLFTFVYKNTLLFSLFRDISKFAVLYAFGISLLFPLFLTSVFKIKKRIYSLLLISLVGFILFINPLFLSGNFANVIVPFQPPIRYYQLKDFISKFKGDFRVAFYPNSGSIGDYDWYKKLEIANGSPYFNFFTSFLPLTKNIAISNRSLRDFGSRYLDFLEVNLDQSWATQRLGEANIRLIIIDHSLPDFTKVLNSAKKNPSLKELAAISGFSIFEIKDFSKQYLMQRKPVYFFGDLNGLQQLPISLALIDLGFNPISLLAANLSDTLLLHNTSLNDLFLTSLKDFRFSFFPEAQQNIEGFLPSADNIRDLSFRGVNTYNPESIFTGSITSISKQLNLKPGNYQVFLSILTGENDTLTDAVGLNIGKKYSEKKGFKKNIESFLWLDFGKITISSEKDILTLKNLENKYFILDSLLIIPEKDYNKKLIQFKTMLKSKSIINLDKDFDMTSFNLNADPIYLYSKNYSPYWNICNSPTFIVNFYEIGSNCNKNSTPNSKFTPTWLYNISLALSLLFNSAIIIYILKLIFIYRRDKTH